MPLPDATKDKRIYQLLKNIDLGNLTFSEFQTAAQSVFAEPEAEDTLRRIVLVNLARMSVAGDWDGLTTAAAASTQYAIVPPDVQAGLNSTYGKFSPLDRNCTFTTSINNTSIDSAMLLFPFTAPISGTMSTITIRTNQTNTGKDSVRLAIYSSDDNDLPATRLGTLDIDVNGGTGLFSSSSWDSAPTLTAGSTYFYGYNSTGATPPTIATRLSSLFLGVMGFTHYPGTMYGCLQYDTDFVAPATIDPATELIGYNPSGTPIFYFVYA